MLWVPVRNNECSGFCVKGTGKALEKTRNIIDITTGCKTSRGESFSSCTDNDGDYQTASSDRAF